MQDKIFGYDWKDIQAMQQKTYKPKKIDTSKPEQTKPITRNIKE